VATTSECQDVVVTAGQTSYINFGNFQLGSVTGCKYNDINGDGDRDNEDFQIEGWTIRLYNSDWSLVAETQTIASSGGQIKYNFSNVMTNGIYYICEVMQPGWIQTDPVLGIEQSDVIANSSPNSAFEGPYCRVINNYQSNGYWYGERFGNIEVKLELTLAKENSVSGSTVTYTLTVENTGNQPLAVTVYDSLQEDLFMLQVQEFDGAEISDPTNNIVFNLGI
jgi:uncharacterized repeat protein (TIGR01451 family)